MLRTRTLKPPALSEHQIQTAVMNRLQVSGWLVIRVNSFAQRVGQRYVRAYIIHQLQCSSGFPDIVAFRGGAFLMIEVKDANGKHTESQERFGELAKRFGVEVHTVRSVDEAEGLVNPRVEVRVEGKG